MNMNMQELINMYLYYAALMDAYAAKETDIDTYNYNKYEIVVRAYEREIEALA